MSSCISTVKFACLVAIGSPTALRFRVPSAERPTHRSLNAHGCFDARPPHCRPQPRPPVSCNDACRAPAPQPLGLRRLLLLRRDSEVVEVFAFASVRTGEPLGTSAQVPPPWTTHCINPVAAAIGMFTGASKASHTCTRRSSASAAARSSSALRCPSASRASISRSAWRRLCSSASSNARCTQSHTW